MTPAALPEPPLRAAFARVFSFPVLLAVVWVQLRYLRRMEGP